MLRFIILVTCVSYSYEFLLDSSTQGSVNRPITDNHYDNLLKMYKDERNARLELQQYVFKQLQKQTTKQQQQDALFSALQTHVEELAQGAVTNKTENCENKYIKLEQEFNVLKEEHILVENKLQTAENESRIILEVVESLKRIQVNNQLQCLDSVQKQINSVQHDVNILTSQGRSRGRDFVALYNEYNKSKNKLSMVENQQKFMQGNLSLVEKMETILNRNVTKVSAAMYGIAANLSGEITNLSLKQHTIETTVQTALRQITEDRTNGFTAFGTSYGTKSKGAIIKFPNIKLSSGLTNLSTFRNTGIFACEKTGLYLISVTVMSRSASDSMFGIYKNENSLAAYYIGRADNGATSEAFNTGSGTLLVQLNKGDTVSIKTVNSNMYVYEYWSSIAVVKQN